MSAETISKLIGVICALGAIWARFIALEEARDNQRSQIVELRIELDKVSTRVLSLEKDRAMLDRLHSMELRLVSLEEQQRDRRR